jgi:hypothetical protein
VGLCGGLSNTRTHARLSGAGNVAGIKVILSSIFRVDRDRTKWSLANQMSWFLFMFTNLLIKFALFSVEIWESISLSNEIKLFPKADRIACKLNSPSGGWKRWKPYFK